MSDVESYTMFRQALLLRKSQETPLLRSIFHIKFPLIIAQLKIQIVLKLRKNLNTALS